MLFSEFKHKVFKNIMISYICIYIYIYIDIKSLMISTHKSLARSANSPCCFLCLKMTTVAHFWKEPSSSVLVCMLDFDNSHTLWQGAKLPVLVSMLENDNSYTLWQGREFPVLLSMLENDNRYTLLEGAQPMISSSKVEKQFLYFFFGGPSLGAPWVSPRHRKSSRALRWRSCVRALRCNSLSHVSTVVSGLEVSVTTASLSRGCQMRDSHQVR